ncbi:dihydropteroate synthase [bacterium]|nr:dihydropteroate synthase [bacterium]
MRPIFSKKNKTSNDYKKLGSSNLFFDTIEIITRKKDKTDNKFLKLEDLSSLKKEELKSVLDQIKNITAPRKKIASIDFNRPKIMGILNVTPDSFSDGGKFNNLDKSTAHASQMIKDGADIIDIGGESTRPGATTIVSKVEIARVIPAIKKLKSKNKKTIISLDTRKPDVMRVGIKNNIDLINDVSGLRYSSKSIDLIKKNKIPFVLMHSIKNPKTMQSNINYENVLLDVYDFFKKKIAICERKKINRQSIILDPGIGFGKTVKQNLSLISNIALLHSLGCPVLLGSSRKTFIGKLDKNALEEKRLGGSLSTVIYALSQGVQVFRVHDVFETSQAIKVFNKL